MAFSLSSCSSSLSSALETKPKSIGRRKAKLSVRTRAAKADDVTRDLKTSRTTITTTTVALLTAFVVALSSSAPEHAAKADGQVFGLSPKVLAPGKKPSCSPNEPLRRTSRAKTHESSRTRRKKTFWKGVKRSRGSRAKARRSGRRLNEEAKSEEERTPREIESFFTKKGSFPEKSSLFTLSLIEGCF